MTVYLPLSTSGSYLEANCKQCFNKFLYKLCHFVVPHFLVELVTFYGFVTLSNFSLQRPLFNGFLRFWSIHQVQNIGKVN